MADMWTHRKFVSARIPFFFWPHLIAIENWDQDKIFNSKNIEKLCQALDTQSAQAHSAYHAHLYALKGIYAQNFILQFMSIMIMVRMNVSRMYFDWDGGGCQMMDYSIQYFNRRDG